MRDSIFLQDMQNHYPPLGKWRAGYAVRYPVLTWQRRQRRLERLDLKSRSPLERLVFFWLKYRHLQHSVRLGFSIPLHVFGAGLSIAHWGTIAVDGKARIGANCRIHQGVTIGSAKGAAPQIGDDCFIGANATVIGGVTLGNGVKIGANALVNASFPDGAVLVGVPAVDVSRRA